MDEDSWIAIAHRGLKIFAAVCTVYMLYAMTHGIPGQADDLRLTQAYMQGGESVIDHFLVQARFALFTKWALAMVAIWVLAWAVKPGPARRD
jgi:hypothetical protein